MSHVSLATDPNPFFFVKSGSSFFIKAGFGYARSPSGSAGKELGTMDPYIFQEKKDKWEKEGR